MLYRATESATVQVGQMRYAVVEDKEYDDSDPTAAALIKRFPQFFRADNVEQATAGPGEKRSTTRRR